MTLCLLDRLQSILPMANEVAEDIVCEETELLEDIIRRMFKLMQKVARFSCDYVRRGAQSYFWIERTLMVAARTVGGQADRAMIEEMDRDLRKVIKEFDRAVDVEALRLAKRTGTSSLLRSGESILRNLYRAGLFTRAAQICRYELSPGPPLFGRHSRISSQKNHNLGDQ